MDPNGGMNPSNPRLDGVAPRPAPERTAGMSPQTQQNIGVQPSQPINSAVPSVTPPTIENPIPSQNSFSAPLNQNPVPQNNLLDTPQEPAQKSPVLKKILIVLATVIGILVIAGGSFYLGYVMGTSNGRKLADADFQKQQAEAQQLESEESQPEDSSQELTIDELVEPKYIDETIEAEVAKQVQASDGFVLKVVNIERNFKSEDPNYKLDTSKELIKVNFLMGNADKSKAKDISSFNFRLEDSRKALLTPENIAEYEGKFDTVKLDPGGQTKGSIVYAVNKDEKPLNFVREQRYRISGENREVTTKIVVVVAK